MIGAGLNTSTTNSKVLFVELLIVTVPTNVILLPTLATGIESNVIVPFAANVAHATVTLEVFLTAAINARLVTGLELFLSIIIEKLPNLPCCINGALNRKILGNSFVQIKRSTRRDISFCLCCN